MTGTHATPTTLDLTADPVTLTRALVDVASVSHHEDELADALEAALRTQAPHLEVLRSGNAVLARTRLGRPHRIVLAGHIDTVPIADNVPSTSADGVIHGCGTSDMKSGDAIFAHLAATVPEPRHDLTFVFYDCEEVGTIHNGLGRVEAEHRDWLDADLAILGEPTDGTLEAGCQGTMRGELRTAGRRSHSARWWLGDNAIHRAGEILDRFAGYTARDVEIDGCVYREGLQAVGIRGGVAGNVVPDECVVSVNFRFAPDRTAEQAVAHVREVFDGFELTVTDISPGALPGLSAPAAAEFVRSTGVVPRAKYGWTDVSRFAALGIPAVNYGPGDPNLAHTREEHVAEAAITACADVLRGYLAP
ncbi:succinyl-diaminopimelate desuccinylase [Pseudonocardia sp. HH130630-07]|uniref:succinyl-diaminopimelate desuccinylase n=1 Tax=Pseudonocardia sp. HH130630-07 TaxID=1690815 RepID=UPI0009F6D3E4|nr:succinyl-diaminopimelate desuccinylase [Pseudonocardia sp. HH130630-07]